MLDRRPDVPDYDMIKRIRTMFLTTFCSLISTAAALLFATTAFAADPPQQSGRLGGKGLPLPYRRGPARTEAALCDNR